MLVSGQGPNGVRSRAGYGPETHVKKGRGNDAFGVNLYVDTNVIGAGFRAVR